MSNVCRLCLNAASNHYEDLKIIHREYIELVLPEIDLNVVKISLICNECLNLLKTTYEFKTNCLQTERLIKSYVEKLNVDVIDLNDILKGEYTYGNSILVPNATNIANSDNDTYTDNDKNNIKNFSINVKDEVKYEGNAENCNNDDCFNDTEEYTISDSKNIDDNEIGLFKCEICSENYDNQRSLLDHIPMHFRQPKCNICKEVFLNYNTFKEHSFKLHKININDTSENFDGIEFELDHQSLDEAIKKHLELYDTQNIEIDKDDDDDTDTDSNKDNKNERIDVSNNYYKCEVCEKDFDEKVELSNHIKTHFYRLKCLTCNKLLCTIQSFRKHILAVHKNLFKRKLQDLEEILKIVFNKDGLKVSNNSCPICNSNQKNCNCSSNLDFSCIPCDKTIPKECYFKHRIAHLIKNNNFDCEYCQKEFVRKSALTRHIEEVHLGIRKQYTPRSIYTCDVCGSTTHRKSRLTQHMRTHTGEKPYKCDECGKAFAQSSQLGVHKRTKHSDYSRFTCEYCSKALKSKYSLNMHILIMHKPEELERKFECHVCEKKFRFPGELTNHLTWHSEDRKYSCEVCGKRFVNQPSVKKHMVIHSGEKKHKCEICGKGFHHKSYIKVHMKVHKRIL